MIRSLVRVPLILSLLPAQAGADSATSPWTHPRFTPDTPFSESPTGLAPGKIRSTMWTLFACVEALSLPEVPRRVLESMISEIRATHPCSGLWAEPIWHDRRLWRSMDSGFQSGTGRDRRQQPRESAGASRNPPFRETAVMSSISPWATTPSTLPSRASPSTS